MIFGCTLAPQAFAIMSFFSHAHFIFLSLFRTFMHKSDLLNCLCTVFCTVLFLSALDNCKSQNFSIEHRIYIQYLITLPSSLPCRHLFCSVLLLHRSWKILLYCWVDPTSLHNPDWTTLAHSASGEHC